MIDRRQLLIAGGSAALAGLAMPLSRASAAGSLRVASLKFGSFSWLLETIRAEGKDGMPGDRYAQFVRHHEQGELAAPEHVARALAALALHAPNAWSGEFIRLDDEQLAALMKERLTL